MNTIIELHNYFRKENNCVSLCNNELLQYYAQQNARWMARRQWLNYWKYAYVQETLKLEFVEINYNIGVGDNCDVVMKHFLNDRVRSDKVFGNYSYIGVGSYSTNYTYWCVLYAK